MPNCFRCDGTEEICDICGESSAACTCGAEGEEPTFSPCPECCPDEATERELSEGTEIPDDEAELLDEDKEE